MEGDEEGLPLVGPPPPPDDGPAGWELHVAKAIDEVDGAMGGDGLSDPQKAAIRELCGAWGCCWPKPWGVVR